MIENVREGMSDFVGEVHVVRKGEKIRDKKMSSGSLHLRAIFLTRRRSPVKVIQIVSCFLCAVICCTAYADENKYIFVGQNENEGFAKTAFILELVGDDLENHVQINGNGEVFLKVDKIVAVPKEVFSHFAQHANTGEQSYAAQGVGENSAVATFGAATSLEDKHEELEIRCRKCRYYYTPRPGRWDCPRCGTSN